MGESPALGSRGAGINLVGRSALRLLVPACVAMARQIFATFTRLESYISETPWGPIKTKGFGALFPIR